MTVDLRFMPCVEFEGAIHEFVDDELAQADVKALMVHLELCESCSSAVELVRRQIRAHRDAVGSEEFLGRFDAGGFFQNLTGELLVGNLERLAELLYELGKAYFLSANDSKLSIFVHKKAMSIERARSEGQRVVKETSALAEKSDGATSSRKTRKTLRRTGQLFRRSQSRDPKLGQLSGRTTLDNARRFLEEALLLNPELPKARYYLGFYFQRIDRPDEAQAEFRRILSVADLEPSLRALTLQALGNVYYYRADYTNAIHCYEEILTLGVHEDARFFHVLVGLAMLYAKSADYERSYETFSDLVARFPQKIEEARSTIQKAEVFRAQLQQNAPVWNEFVTRYPMLFAG